MSPGGRSPATCWSCCSAGVGGGWIDRSGWGQDSYLVKGHAEQSYVDDYICVGTARLPPIYLLQCRGYALSKPADLEAVRGLKEGLCYVAQDTAQEAKVGVRAEGGQCLGGWEASRWSRIHRMRPLGRRKGGRDRGGAVSHISQSWRPGPSEMHSSCAHTQWQCASPPMLPAGTSFSLPSPSSPLAASIPSTPTPMQLARETTCLTRSYTLPDGRVIRVGAERFLAPEALFDPSLADVEGPGIARMAFDAIQVTRGVSCVQLVNDCGHEHCLLKGRAA